MSQSLLSILIPTINGREEQVERLLQKLYDQRIKLEFPNEVQIQVKKDNKEMSIGEKRELLYKESIGLYSWQIDDDDDIFETAIEKILDAIKSNADISCITFREKCIINGKYYSSNHSIKYDKWKDNYDGFDYVRTPFYKDIIRTDIAKSVPFEHIRWNEDERWSYAIKPYLTDEIHIDEEIYYYIHNSSDPKERYGLD